MKQVLLVYLFMLSVKVGTIAQPFKLLRYDEDYSTFKDSTSTAHNRIKYIQLSDQANIYFSLGFDMRQELDYAVNEDWGETGLGTDIFWLQRYNTHVDFHVGDRLRLFGQLRSGLEDGRKNGPRRIDEDKLNVQNLFLDIIPYKNADKSLTLRLGRQEMQYGSGRLVDVRNGPNLRLYFDGIKTAYHSPRLKVDAFVLADSKVNFGVFDNVSNRKPNLWGTYSTFGNAHSMNVDLYYLGIDRANATYDDGVGNELRHTVGARFWRNKKGFSYNFEGAYQFGNFGNRDISAWTCSAEISFSFDNIQGAPVVKLRHDYISGDKTKGDDRLGTFNPLYPKGGYFGFNPQVGPANLIDLHPSILWKLIDNVAVDFNVVLNWRYAHQDGIYGPNGLFVLSSSGSSESFIGTAYLTSVSWDINSFLNFNTGLQYFKTGNFIDDVVKQHKDGFFVGSVLEFTF
ncbi:alginate export family protein [Sphingobacterium bambusae]|uniref:Alginate export family protein n=1 Tax=Sphingobacterium bambusae TaxID=662858 RepID=A0ABW6BDI4_9SPHI|nr:alginate export family protein [Sphingobacterium bambusae]WPL48813.1 alginate export family protein [Sphingobacterium bambusae]